MSREHVQKLTFPDNNKPGGVRGGEEGLVEVESDSDGGAGVRLQLVHAGARGAGEVEEVNSAVLGGGDNAVSGAEGHNGSKSRAKVQA